MAGMDYLNFDVAIVKAGHGYEVQMLSPVGPARGPFVLPVSFDRVDLIWGEIEKTILRRTAHR